MKIFLDAMGGDNAPQAPVEGAIEALRRFLNDRNNAAFRTTEERV